MGDNSQQWSSFAKGDMNVPKGSGVYLGPYLLPIAFHTTGDTQLDCKVYSTTERGSTGVAPTTYGTSCPDKSHYQLYATALYGDALIFIRGSVFIVGF